MDWVFLFQIVLYVFASAGLILTVLLIVVAASDNGSTPKHERMLHEESLAEQVESKYDYLDRPTIKGRVDAIEKHLGIEVYVKPARAQEIAVRSVKDKGGNK